MSSEAEIRAIIEAWSTAVHRRDIDGVMAHHADDLLMFDVVGPLQARGVASYRQSWLEEFFPWHGGTGRFDLKELQVTAGTEVAFATALIDCAGMENSQAVALTLRLTVGLKKSAGRWLITHEHHSEPLPFDRSTIGDKAA